MAFVCKYSLRIALNNLWSLFYSFFFRFFNLKKNKQSLEYIGLGFQFLENTYLSYDKKKTELKNILVYNISIFGVPKIRLYVGGSCKYEILFIQYQLCVALNKTVVIITIIKNIMMGT